jgi:hypothetical protein
MIMAAFPQTTYTETIICSDIVVLENTLDSVFERRHDFVRNYVVDSASFGFEVPFSAKCDPEKATKLVVGVACANHGPCYHRMSNKLIVSIDYSTGLVFPKEPTHRKIDDHWTAIYEYIVHTIGLDNARPDISASRAGYIVGFTKNIATERVSNDQLDSYIESVSGLLKSPHAQQILFSALFCRWVFVALELMLHAMHLDGMMHLFEGILTGASDIGAEHKLRDPPPPFAKNIDLLRLTTLYSQQNRQYGYQRTRPEVTR